MLVTSYKKKILLVITLIILIIQTVLAQEECSLRKEKDNIRVYSCTSSDTKLNIVRAEFDLYSSIDNYLELVRDVKNYKNWHFRVMEPAELERNNPNSIIYYTQISAPWPVNNRDLVLHLTLDLNNDGSLLVTLKSLPDYIEHKDEFVRIPFSHSEMKMVPVADNHIKVSYWIKANPGGSIPSWVTNMVSTQGPYETFKRMKEVLESVPITSNPEYSAADTSGRR